MKHKAKIFRSVLFLFALFCYFIQSKIHLRENSTKGSQIKLNVSSPINVEFLVTTGTCWE